MRCRRSRRWRGWRLDRLRRGTRLARLHAHDWRPPRGALEARDVDLDVDEACRAHRPGQHARSAFSLRAVRAAGPHQNNYATDLCELRRFDEAKSLLRKAIPVARRVIGASHQHTITMRSLYAKTFFHNPGATIDEIREAVNTLEEIEPISRRVLGIAHPIAVNIQGELQKARALLRAREAGKNVVFVRE